MLHRWRQWAQLWNDIKRPQGSPPAIVNFSAEKQLSPQRVSGPLTTKVQVVDLQHETADTLSVVLKRLDGLPFQFLPGMFVTLLLPMEGQIVPRAYSIASAVQAPETIVITVKRTPDGWASAWLHEHLQTGMELTLRGPDGHFILRPDSQRSRQIIMIAGGSGITPILSMLLSCLPVEESTVFHLVYASRDPESIIFRERLQALTEEFPEKLEITWVVESATADWQGETGRLSNAMLQRVLTDRDFAHSSAYLCGPEPLMLLGRDFLLASGVPAQAVMQEQFSRPKSPEAQEFSAQALTIEIGPQVWKGETEKAETLLESGLRLGVPMPYSCTLGGCGRCRIQVLEGQVYMPEPNGLMEDEKIQGYALACQAHPCSAVKIRVAPPALGS